MKWTDAQEAAIQTHGKTLLVSAAAGSGKTATLTERIIRSVMDEKEGKDISRLLIVTYTRAAAAELKVKISKALSSALAENPGNPRLTSQMMMLESARICTIDSFYYDIVKSNFNRLGICGNLRIVDGAEMSLICKNEMENLIDDFYASDDSFINFMDHFVAVRGENACADIFIGIYQSLLSYRGGVSLLTHYSEMLHQAANEDFLKTPYGATAAQIAEYELSYSSKILKTACDFFEASGGKLLTNYYPAFMNDLKTVSEALRAIHAADYERARQTFADYQKLALKTIRGEKDPYVAYLQELRSGVIKQIAGLGEDYFSLVPEDISALILSTADVVDHLFRLLNEYHKRIMSEKERRGICDFTDIRRYVLELLLDKDGNPTDLAADYRDRFDEIYIDEYQDVDEMQDLIFSAISKPNNRFMVGDIKQSIYGFRGADSGVFARYKGQLPVLGSEAATDACGNSIFMSDNFRCDKNIVKFANLVSSYLFTYCGQNIGYCRQDDLIFSKALPHESYESPKVILALTGIEPEDEEKSDTEEEKIYYEAEYIASEIIRLTSSEKKADGTPIRFDDIAILMRNMTDLEALTSVLDREGIPSQSETNNNFFEDPDILLVISLLSVIDNPRRDIPLAGTLRSPLFGFSFDDLITIRHATEPDLSLFDAIDSYALSGDSLLHKKCSSFLDALQYWRTKATALSVDKLIKMLYREFSLLSLNGSENSRLLRLYEYARNFEANSFHGLYNFISYIGEIMESGAKLDKTDADLHENAVRIITIHHSKGLEYPVCFLYGMGKAFVEKEKKNKIQFDKMLGLGMLLHDNTGFASVDTPVRRAIIDRRTLASREEEMRVLYVAMTRARERLYLTATVKNPEKLEIKIRSYLEFGKEFGIRSSNCYLDWIVCALRSDEKNDCYKIEKIYKNVIRPSDNIQNNEIISQTENTLSEDVILTDLFRKRFSYEYPYRHISSLPAKLSVSALYPAVLDETDNSEIDALSLEDAFVYPESILPNEHISGAEKGTATHTFLQFCDFDKIVSYGVAEELNRLKEQKFIDEKTANLCNIRQLEKFFQSDLFSRIRSASNVWREQRFNIFLPASDFTQLTQKAEQLAKETIAVQGVIDIFFQEKNGNLILVDYKTDFLTQEEIKHPELAAQKLTERHREQLTYYAKAIRQICGKKPDEILIYSLPLGKTISL